MKRYLIEEAQCGITKGGFACGPISGQVITSIKYNDGAGSKWLSIAEYDGFPMIYVSERDIFDDLIKDAFEDEAFMEYLEAHKIGDFDGVYLGGEYQDVFEGIYEDPENPAARLLKYAIALTRCAEGEEKDLIDMASGKYVDELDIPISDVEEDYMEDLEELDDEEEDEETE